MSELQLSKSAEYVYPDSIYGAKVFVLDPMSAPKIVTSDLLQIITIENQHAVIKNTDESQFQTEFMSREIGLPISDFAVAQSKIPIKTLLDEQVYFDFAKVVKK